MTRKNPLGAPVANWTPPPLPDVPVLEGRRVRLERLVAQRHAAELFDAYAGDDALWDYMPVGPFHSAAAFHRWAAGVEDSRDPLFYAIIDRASGRPVGQASFLRVTPAAGTIEVGYIVFSPLMQRSALATEAMFLMMQWAFEAGYRRYEWKCDALNMPSRRAAQRLGFTYEGVFRQATVVKGRNRDTAWFAVIDSEWPALKEAFTAWLAPRNFDANDRQAEHLSDLTALVRAGFDPLQGG